MSETWRVGEHYGIHVYAGDRPVATFHRADDAARAVAAVNALEVVANPPTRDYVACGRGICAREHGHPGKCEY